MSETSHIPPPDYGRPLSIEEYSNRFVVHPLSGLIEKMAISTGLSANFVSFMGLGAGWLAALFYYYQDHRIYVLGGFLCMLAWHVFDGADGRVARATNTSSAFGRIIDGICDHLVFGAVYIAIVLHLINSGSSQAVWLLGLAAAVSHGLQAAGYEERRQKYQRRLKGVQRDEVSQRQLDVDGSSSILAKVYDKGQRLVSGKASPLDRVIAYNRNLKIPEPATQSIIFRTGKIVRTWALLNANNRTLMIAVFAWFKHPELYFIYEIIVLNIVLFGLIIYERLAEKRIAIDATLGLQPAI